MSVVPRTRSEYSFSGHRYSRDISASSKFSEFPGTINQLRHVLDKSVEGIVSTDGEEGFQINMDVNQYKPSELTVKTVNNEIVIEGKHEEGRDADGYISRHFTRRYALPQGCSAKQVTSSLSPNGVLTVRAPLPSKVESTENYVKIERIGPSQSQLSVRSGGPK